MAISRLILATTILLCATYVFGHSYVTSPTSRSNQRQTNAGCRGPNCLGPCDVPLSKASTPAVTIGRGANINVQWPRNNHPGGFIRFAWAPTSGSDSHANFDNNVQEIHCHEIGGCGPDDINNPMGGDSGPADGSSRACQTTIQVPLHLTDGDWTLQWAWFGGAYALGDYYSCVDYKISGGQSVAQKSAALFYGGDFTYPGQNKCKFFNTDRLHQCVNEPCNNPIYPGSSEQSGPAYGVAIASSTQKPASPATTLAPQSLTTQQLTTAMKPVQNVQTTGPVTTRILTTASKAVAPMTTGSTSSAKPDASKNCAGLTNAIDSSLATLSIVSVDTWGTDFRMVVQIESHASISDWALQVIWPAGATNTQIDHVYNAGQMLCSAPSRHEMIDAVARWANTLYDGTRLFIEIKAKNTNMDGDFIKANTQLKMFRK